MYSWAVLQAVNLFALKFHLDRVVLVNRSYHQKLRYPIDGEDQISLRSFVLTQCRSVSGGRTDGQTDGRTDLP